MTIGLAIESRRVGANNVATDGASHARQPAPGEAIGTLPIGAGDPAVEIAGPERFTSIERVRYGRARYGMADALVAFAIMVWLTATLAALAGEFQGGTSTPVTHAGVAAAAPTTQAHVAASLTATVRSAWVAI